MNALESLSIKVSNFKCFGDEPQGFVSIKPLNIIIGPNNIGKSTLLDALDFRQNYRDQSEVHHKGKLPRLAYSIQFTSEVIDLAAKPGSLVQQHLTYIRRILGGHTFLFEESADQKLSLIHDGQRITPNTPELMIYALDVGTSLVLHFKSLAFKRLAADRDLRAELDAGPYFSINEQDLTPDGIGATRILQRMLNNNNRDHHRIVEHEILGDINWIFDEEYARIRVLRRQDSYYEVFLDNADGMATSMSMMGSGMRTVLLVLMYIRVLPKVVFRRPVSDFVFGFEEIENNLHPLIQKRLFQFLLRFALDNECRFFITTHSHVVIDLFSRNPNAQILHVQKKLGQVIVDLVTDHVGQTNVFSALDVRASDLLQSNVVVWVEGPSDRIYFNKWMDLLTGGMIKEGVQYQCVFSAGSILSRYTFEVDETRLLDEYVRALKINRNAIVLMDSDKENRESTLKQRVFRVNKEVEDAGGLAWITHGREVENYLPVELIRGLCKSPDAADCEPGPFESVFEFIVEHGGADWSHRKPEMAVKLSSLMTREMLVADEDLRDMVERVRDQILLWNGGVLNAGSHSQTD